MAGGAIDFLRDADWLDGRRVRGYAVIVGIASLGLLIVSWIEAMGPNGRLGVIERDGPVGKGVVYARAGEGAGRRVLFDATPPVLPGFARERRFAF